MRTPFSWPVRIAIFAVIEIALALVCVNVTTAGILTEEYAEMHHGGLSMLAFLWMFKLLRGQDAAPRGDKAW